MRRWSSSVAFSPCRVAALVVALSLGSCTRAGDNVAPASAIAGPSSSGAAMEGCTGPAVVTAPGTPGAHRRLALIVAVGRFKNADIPKLDGPPNDAKKIYDLLTNERGYAFPKGNVCMLVNEQATLGQFDKAFKQALTARTVKGQNDSVVVFFSGHGSTTLDVSGDEANGFDQTWVLHDSRTEGKHDLLDDHVFELISELAEKTSNITFVLDSCNSGSAIRDGALVPRAIPAEKLAGEAQPTQPAPAVPKKGDGSNAELPKQIPGLVLLAATRDGTFAYEAQASGIFTDALVRVLGGRGASPLTYDQIQSQVRSLVAAESPQVPAFEGDLDRVVFGNQVRPMPLGLRVVSVGEKIVLRGPPIPGMGSGAELRVYGDDQTAAAVADPALSIATLRVESKFGELEPVAAVLEKGPAKGAMQKDDLAVLAKPSPEFTRLRVRLRPASEPRGVPAARAAKICEGVMRDLEARSTVRLIVDGPAAAPCTDYVNKIGASDAVRVGGGEGAHLEVSRGSDDVLDLRDTDDLLRRRYAKGEAEPGDVVRNLWAHARQFGILAYVPEGGPGLVENKTIKVTIRRNPKREKFACEQGSFKEPQGSEPYHVPICFRYVVDAELSKESPVPLRVGGLILSSDGKIVPLLDQLDTILQPGARKVLGEAVSGPPDRSRDTIVVIGTQAKSRIRIEQLATLGGMMKAAGPEEPEVPETAWTRTIVGVEVYANPEFAPPPHGAPVPKGEPTSKEYTLATYDIRPFLPRNASSALHGMLEKADWLANYSKANGVPYKKHDWSKRSDAANLKEGIDCSRAVHFAFTRAGLSYNDAEDTTPGRPADSGKGRYLPTVEMARGDGPMKKYFDRCDDEPKLRTGDVLVYRDDVQQDGHTIIVIDPERRVGWGSHGWDGNAKPGKPPYTGVEYQLIKYKPDWERWDRKTMVRKACWRYRKFTEEEKEFDNRPGSMPMDVQCKQLVCGKVPHS